MYIISKFVCNESRIIIFSLVLDCCGFVFKRVSTKPGVEHVLADRQSAYCASLTVTVLLTSALGYQSTWRVNLTHLALLAGVLYVFLDAELRTVLCQAKCDYNWFQNFG